MIIEQIYTGCLAQGAYYIESEGEVAIIDPLREVQSYIDKAASNQSKIKYVFETHFHADFVSGHLTLSEKTGAKIVYGPNAKPSFDCVIAKDEQVFQLGKIQIKVLHTPGHTLESSSYLLIDEQGNEKALFTGDTLFLGDVGRPDLAQKKNEFTQEDLAGLLFDSLRNKIMPLADDLIIYPGHGAGSACGKNMSKETVGTLGEQKQSNYALRANMTKQEFIKEVTTGLTTPPAYFPLNVKLNREGYEDVQEIIKRGKVGLNPDDFENIANQTRAIILDVRTADEFAKAHVPNSIFIGINGGFAPWVGALIKDVEQQILLVCEPDQLTEAITRLSRVGFDHVLGHLEGGIKAWINSGKSTDEVATLSANEFEQLSEKNNLTVFDVRKESEFLSERLESSTNTPLDVLNNYLDGFKKGENNYIHCAGGYRSMIAISILKARGIHNLVNIDGGFAALKNTGLKTTDYVCPSTL